MPLAKKHNCGAHMTHPQEGGEEPSIKKGAGEVELGFAASIAPRDTPSPPKETPSQEEISKETPSLVFDHGFRAWSQVFVTFLLVVNGFGYLSSFGLFQTYWMNKLDRSASSISWIGSIQMFLLFFIGTLSGRAMDAGYFRSLIWVGCAMQILGTFTTANCGQYWQLVLSQGIVQGLGNGLLFTPAVTLVSTYFSKKRAFALGISACGAPFGGIVFPLVRTPYIQPAQLVRYRCNANVVGRCRSHANLLERSGFHGLQESWGLFNSSILSSSCFLLAHVLAIGRKVR